RQFGGKNLVSLKKLEDKFINCVNREDILKLSLVYFLKGVLLKEESKCSIDTTWLQLVDDMPSFIKVSWGTISFRHTFDSLNNALIGRSLKFKKTHTHQEDYIEYYCLFGFPYAFQVCDYFH